MTRQLIHPRRYLNRGVDNPNRCAVNPNRCAEKANSCAENPDRCAENPDRCAENPFSAPSTCYAHPTRRRCAENPFSAANTCYAHPTRRRLCASVDSLRVLAFSSFSLALLMVAAAGLACNQPPAVNPYRDDSIPADTWSTPSRDGIIAAAGDTKVIRQRQVPQAHTPYVQSDVPHYPLWWEDPLEDKGDQNADFAWTWQDYVAMPYSFGRFLLNTMAWPVSAAVTPPGTAMVSDGRIGRDHDAKPGHSPDPTATRDDFVYAESDTPITITPSTRPAS